MARSEAAAEVAQSISLAVQRASEMRDEAVEAAHTARARTAEARAKTCEAGGNDAQHEARTPPPQLQDSAFPRATAFRVWPFDK
jgi:hypothetical protein